MGSFFSAQFTGGMNEVISPALLDEKTACYLANADISNGKISSIKRPLLLTGDSPESYGHFGTRERSAIKWYERTYWSNNHAPEAPFYGGVEENYLGIPYPDYSKDVKFDKVDSGNLSGKHKYCVTFVNANGWEGAPGALSDYERVQELTDNKVKITVSWSDDRVSYAKVYRTAKEGADFFCIGEVRESGSSITDNVDDYTLAGLEPLSSIDNYPPPDNGKYLCESGGVFFLVVGSTLHFSVPGNPHAWPPLNFIGMDETITGICAEFMGVLVFTANNTYRVIGADSVETLTKTLIPGNQGCVNYNSVAKVANAPIWLSNDGICLWDGESISLISKQVINTRHLQVICAVSADDCYYLFLRNGAIVFDRRHGGVFSRLGVFCDYAWYDADRDVLFLQIGRQIYQHAAGELATYRYVSPLIGVPESTYSYYKELIVCVDGTARIIADIDGKEALQANISMSGRYRLKFPFNSLGRGAQVTVEGVGSLKEIGVVYQ